MMRAPRKRMTITRLHGQVNRRFTGLEDRAIRRFESIDTRFNAIDARFNAIDTRFDSMEARITAQFADVNRRLDSLGEKLEAMVRALTHRIDSFEAHMTTRFDRHWEIFHEHESGSHDSSRGVRSRALLNGQVARVAEDR